MDCVLSFILRVPSPLVCLFAQVAAESTWPTLRLRVRLAAVLAHPSRPTCWPRLRPGVSRDFWGSPRFRHACQACFRHAALPSGYPPTLRLLGASACAGVGVCAFKLRSWRKTLLVSCLALARCTSKVAVIRWPLHPSVRSGDLPLSLTKLFFTATVFPRPLSQNQSLPPVKVPTATTKVGPQLDSSPCSAAPLFADTAIEVAYTFVVFRATAKQSFVRRLSLAVADISY